MIERLLPIERHALHPQEPTLDYLYEPAPGAIFAQILPKHVEIQVWRALLESDAAEHGRAHDRDGRGHEQRRPR